LTADLKRDRDQWRALAITAAGTIVCLVVRVLRNRALAEQSWKIAREYFSGKLPLVDQDDLDDEPWDRHVMRRLGACEVHLVSIEERLPEKAPLEVIDSLAARVADLEAEDA
jgi:hypothetical protein